MKKTVLTIVVIVITTFAVKGQQSEISLPSTNNNNMEKSINGVEVGLTSFSLFNESRLSNQLSLKSKFGLYYGSFFGTSITPIINFEGRWYYNLNKRSRLGKNASDNAGSFFSLDVQYSPSYLLSKERRDTYGGALHYLSTTVRWGIRRNIGRKFFIEPTVGFGVGKSFSTYNGSHYRAFPNVGLKLGYKFR